MHPLEADGTRPQGFRQGDGRGRHACRPDRGVATPQFIMPPNLWNHVFALREFDREHNFNGARNGARTRAHANNFLVQLSCSKPTCWAHRQRSSSDRVGRHHPRDYGERLREEIARSQHGDHAQIHARSAGLQCTRSMLMRDALYAR